MKYVVTKTVYLAIEVDADSVDEAIEIAENKDINDWFVNDEGETLAYLDEEEQV